MPQRIGNPQKRRRTFIAAWRKARKLTQERLGEMAGTTKATISRIESGEIAYTRDSLEAIADALGVHPGLLLTRPPLPEEIAAPERSRKRA